MQIYLKASLVKGKEAIFKMRMTQACLVLSYRLIKNEKHLLVMGALGVLDIMLLNREHFAEET